MFFNYRVFWLSALALLSTVAAYFVFGRELTTLGLNILILGVAIIVSLTWTPAAVRVIRDGAKGAASKVILAIWLSWTVLIIQRIYTLAVTILERPTWLVDSVSSSLVITSLIIAGTYAAFATVTEADVPMVERRWVLFSTLVGGICMGVLSTVFYFTGWRF